MAIDFTSEEFKKLKDKLIIEFNQYLKESDFKEYHDLIQILLNILNNSILLDTFKGINIDGDVQLTIEFYFDFLKNNLSDKRQIKEKEDKTKVLLYTFVILYVFLYKAWIVSEYEVGNYNEYYNYIQKLYGYLTFFDNDIKKKIDKYPYFVLNEIYKNYENSKQHIQNARVFLEHINEHMDMIKTYHKTIEKYTSDINTIEDKLKKQRQEFNFIRLADAFKNMKDNKQKELRHEKIFNWVLMGTITALLFLKICWLGNFNIPFINKLPNIEPSNTPYLVMVTISSIFLISVLIYFFRISLINIKSIKSQILQLDLRLSLCQFIHNYAEDSEKMRKDNMKDSLDRFESIIFSPIVANEEQIPATFDNLDQFIKMMNVANGGKGETKS